ncbi:arginyltransferase [Vibrio sp. WXL210]|uniref:arginyltransferase n=1 Tax=Vibrio sp. WXL210 TaxID=3450709 RepID=UPI003EC4C175
MNSDLYHIRIGLTAPHNCAYLPGLKERMAVALDEPNHSPEGYQLLLANGFRRSGEVIYKPHCANCKACEAIRISVGDFKPSQSQKRLLKKASHLRAIMRAELDDNWFDLYSRYIEARHRDGTMYPPKKEDFFKFSHCKWLKPKFLHVYEHDRLVAVAVTDLMPQCGSAFYTFFDPDHPLSLGTLAVLKQIEFCRQRRKPWLYLGYQIDECPAMNYKVRFQRHQRLVNRRWQG